jgi:hypothetical protein
MPERSNITAGGDESPSKRTREPNFNKWEDPPSANANNTIFVTTAAGLLYYGSIRDDDELAMTCMSLAFNVYGAAVEKIVPHVVCNLCCCTTSARLLSDMRLAISSWVLSLKTLFWKFSSEDLKSLIFMLHPREGLLSLL